MRVTDGLQVLAAGEGTATWFAGALMIQKAGGEETGGHFTLLDQHVPAGYATPRHVHHGEDEAWYVLEGEVTFRFGDERFTAGPGTWVFLPRDVPHGFRTGSQGAHLLTFAAPAGFERFVQEAGQPAASITLPPAGPPDMAKLMEAAAKYHLEIVGPPDEI